MTILGIHVSIIELALFVVGATGWIARWAANSKLLPAGARKWLAELSPSCVTAAIEKAEALSELSPTERRNQAVLFLQNMSVKELGFRVPTSIANLLVEFVYQTYRKGTGK